MNKIKLTLLEWRDKARAWLSRPAWKPYRTNILKAIAGIFAITVLGLVLRGCWPDTRPQPPVPPGPDDGTATWVVYGLADGELTAEGRNCVPPNLSRASERRMLDSLKKQVTEPETGEDD